MKLRVRYSIVAGGVFLLFVLWWGAQLYLARGTVEAALQLGVGHIEDAVRAAQRGDFARGEDNLRSAEAEFRRAKSAVGSLGFVFLKHLTFLPAARQAVAAVALIETGAAVTAAAIPIMSAASDFYPAFLGETPRLQTGDGTYSFLDILLHVRDPLRGAQGKFEAAATALRRVDPEAIPEPQRERFLEARGQFLAAEQTLRVLVANEELLVELLGGNGPRKYLFLFQNNNELRATGGFIGTYGILEMKQGLVRRFFIDGVFEPDGQLKENIVPPRPIQKISAGWSLHDSNWYPDFPTSAEKAIFFYEKTGGPTVDGVIAMTQEVLGRLLAATGPITLPEYDLTVDVDNYLPLIQEHVEVRYDQEENRPKKILGDLAGAILERAFVSAELSDLQALASAFTGSLNEKHILLYARAPEIQRLVDELQWSGRMLSTERDYLAVIHSNINGFKTDGVIDEQIHHRVLAAPDGTVTDTVTITRRHTGGHTPYAWWNKVNADYLRVYVPEGSVLLSATGATWEFFNEPLDYDALGFRRDADVLSEEEATVIDEESGTRISRESGKTVFGMWVYVSPQESVTVELRYRLPFRLDTARLASGGERFSVLYQKQPGVPASQLITEAHFPENTTCVWQTESDLIPLEHGWRRESDLRTDRFFGCILHTQQ